MPPSQDQLELQKKLAITPKSASLLMRLGYSSYKDLHTLSPNKLLTELKGLPDITVKQAETYRRACRRIVWLSTQEQPEIQAKACPDWTQKGLAARGVWREDYDDMTGAEVAAHIAQIQRGAATSHLEAV